MILFALVILACTCNFSERLIDNGAEIELTATKESSETPTSDLVEILQPSPMMVETPLLTPEPDVDGSPTMVNPIDGAVLVYVPEGEFLMGGEDDDARDDEKTQHLVYLDAYWIYQHPVTNAQFAAFVEASGHQTTAEETGWARVFDGQHWEETDGAYWGAPQGPGSSIADKGDHPVVQVSWYDAVAYCDWAEGRLPTEAEWEKAARGTDGRRYPWGDGPVNADRANYCDVNCPLTWADTDQDDGYERTSPVGSYPAGASPYGALDMAGNVMEWLADWYAEDYYTLSPDENPIGPSSGLMRVVRGGSWYDNEAILRVSNRGRNFPDNWFIDFYGFRCMRPEAP